MSAESDLRALLAAEPTTDRTLWLRRGHWMMQNGEAVLALLDAAQAHVNDCDCGGTGTTKDWDHPDHPVLVPCPVCGTLAAAVAALSEPRP